jgi:transposase-like protein
VHMVRASLSYVHWKQRKRVAVELRQIYQSATADDASEQLDVFAQNWDAECPMVSQIWRRHWDLHCVFVPFEPVTKLSDATISDRGRKSLVRTAMVFRTRIKRARPIVSCGKRRETCR